MTKLPQTSSASASQSQRTKASVDDPTARRLKFDPKEYERSEAYKQYFEELSRGAAFQYPTARWLDAVIRRLNASIGISGDAPDGVWLDREIVVKAQNVFRVTSDLLPSEPHLSSSRQGNLVADFTSSLGPVSMVVSAKCILLYAVLGGKESTKVLPYNNKDDETLRKALSGFLIQGGIAVHGAMGTR